jgi:hypothetical protein
MSHAYITYLAHQDVTAGGNPIYPDFMQLWPTYLMITAAAVTVLINSCIVFWHIHGTIQDLTREEMYTKYWDYVSHGINVSSTFSITSPGYYLTWRD